MTGTARRQRLIGRARLQIPAAARNRAMPLPVADEGVAGLLQRSENRRNSVSPNDSPGTARRKTSLYLAPASHRRAYFVSMNQVLLFRLTLKKFQSWREYHCAGRKEPAGGTAGCCENVCRRHCQSKEKDRRSGPHLFSFTLAMREAFIEFLQHFQRLLSSE